MPDIRIHRDHKLGLPKARELAQQWAEQAAKKFDMQCERTEGESSDTLEFTRIGVKGQLIVAADHFDVTAELGFLLGAFSQTVETEIERSLDELLKKSGKGSARKAGAGSVKK